MLQLLIVLVVLFCGSAPARSQDVEVAKGQARCRVAVRTKDAQKKVGIIAPEIHADGWDSRKAIMEFYFVTKGDCEAAAAKLQAKYGADLVECGAPKRFRIAGRNVHKLGHWPRQSRKAELDVWD